MSKKTSFSLSWEFGVYFLTKIYCDMKINGFYHYIITAWNGDNEIIISFHKTKKRVKNPFEDFEFVFHSNWNYYLIDDDEDVEYYTEEHDFNTPAIYRGYL